MLSRFMVDKSLEALARTMRRRTYDLPDLVDHLQSGEKKRILVLDGGGVRSALSIAILEKIEEVLKARHGGYNGFRLSDYYDLVGGNSTGGILASALAANAVSAPDLYELYRELVEIVFKRNGRGPRAFNDRAFGNALNELFGKRTFADGKLATGLALIGQRLDTEETVVFHNNNFAPDFTGTSAGQIDLSQLPLAAALTASTARPCEFRPVEVSVGERQRAAFVDSAFSPFTHPAFRMFLLATLPEQGFGWATGKDRLMITSVGTGSLCTAENPKKNSDQRARVRGGFAFLQHGSETSGELMMSLLSERPGPMSEAPLATGLAGAQLGNAPQFTYQRYQARLTETVLREELKLALTQKQLRTVRNVLDRDSFQIAYEIGQAVADRFVKAEHFDEAFDLPNTRPAAPSAEPSKALSANDAARRFHQDRTASQPRLMPGRPHALTPSLRSTPRR